MYGHRHSLALTIQVLKEVGVTVPKITKTTCMTTCTIYVVRLHMLLLLSDMHTKLYMFHDFSTTTTSPSTFVFTYVDVRVNAYSPIQLARGFLL